MAQVVSLLLGYFQFEIIKNNAFLNIDGLVFLCRHFC